MNTPSPLDSNLRRPHPLAVALIERLRARPGAAVIDFGAGSGRNSAALFAAGCKVRAVPDDRTASFAPAQTFDAALSTHALLHGTRASVVSMLQSLYGALKPQAPFYATFASKRDTRYGRGTRIEPDVFAPDDGAESGVAHLYLDEAGLRGLLGPAFVIEAVEERNVDAIAGSWAHRERPRGTVHWFVYARRAQ